MSNPFQSRTGFSDRLDRPGELHVKHVNVSFQSRTGFSDRLDTIGGAKTECIEQFQSRTGFSDRLDTRSRRSIGYRVPVSIPYRVF